MTFSKNKTNKTRKRLGVVAIVAMSILYSCKTSQPVAVRSNPPPSETNPPPTEILVPAEKIALKINNDVITESEYRRLLNRYIITDTVNTSSLEKDILFRQLAYRDASTLGYENNPSVASELATYKSIVYENYTVDSSLVKQLSREAYNHLNQELEVAHIFLPCDRFESPKKIAEVREKIKKIGEQISERTTFETLAQQYSQDKSTANKGGYMGWYTGLQLIYQIEEAAYQLNVGEVSKPVQSEYGFHLVKLLNKRPSRGRITVQHLLRVVPEDASESLQNKQKLLLDSLYYQVINGASFEEIINLYSDDYRTRNQNGILPEFWVGSREEKSFEDAAFSLATGQLSPPIRSSAGWHLIKVLDKNQLPDYRVIKESIDAKVTTDSRGDYISQQWAENAKTALNFIENTSVVDKVISLANENLLKGTWTIPTNSSVLNSYLFSIEGESRSVKDFFDFVLVKQQTIRPGANYRPDMFMRKLYARYVDDQLTAFSQGNLEKVNQDFKSDMQAYKESIVVKNYLNDKIYSKSMVDSTALKQLYAENRANLRYKDRAVIYEVKSTQPEMIAKVTEIYENGMPFSLKKGMVPIYFFKNSTALTDNDLIRLRSLVYYLKKHPEYVVEVGGHSDGNEDVTVSNARVQSVVAQLLGGGVPITQINEIDYKSSQPADRFDWQKNQRVTLRFFSNSLTDLADQLNDKQPDAVSITRSVADKVDFDSKYDIDWKTGVYQLNPANGESRIVIIDEIAPAREKTFYEAKGYLINLYQQQLLQSHEASLLHKYTVEQNLELTNRLIEELKRSN